MAIGWKVANPRSKILVGSQAHIVITKFGGPQQLHRNLKDLGVPKEECFSASAISKWMYPKGHSGGLGGIIPPRALALLVKYARPLGVLLTQEDLMPIGLDERRSFKQMGVKFGGGDKEE